MKILGLETATSLGGAALTEDDRLLAEYRADLTMAHGERLMEMVDRLLRDRGMDIRELEGLAVSIGPGSFTGLRVGIGILKGLAFGRTLPVAAVPTLEALACNLSVPVGMICPMIDARKGEVYAALFRGGPRGGLERRMEDRVLSPRVLAEERAGASDGPTIFLGDGAERYRDMIQEVLGDRARFAPTEHSYPRPASTAVLGYRRIRAGLAEDPKTLVPVYLRATESELRRSVPEGAAGKRHATSPEASAD